MKKIYSIIISVFIYQFNFSQTAPEIEWENTIGGNSTELLYSSIQTSDGGYLLGGYSYSTISGDKTETSNGGYDYWVIKLDANGNISWQNTIGGGGDDYLRSVIQTTDGGYLLGGYSNSAISGDKTETNLGFPDYWVVKLDASGNIIWQNTIGGSSDDYLTSLVQTSDGGYFLGGYSKSVISGDKTEPNQGVFTLAADYWVIKLDNEGNIQWQNTIGGNSEDQLYSAIQTSDGGYFLGSYSYSDISGDKNEDNPGFASWWVLKLDTAGNINWQNTIGGSNYDFLNSVIQTTDGGYLLGGYGYSDLSGDKTEDNNGAIDYWVIKLDNTGNIIWQNSIGGSSYNYLSSVIQTSDGGYLLGGYSNSAISGDKTEASLGLYDYWIVKINSTGTVIWDKTIGGNSEEQLYSIDQSIDGGYILGGASKSGISGDKTETSLGLYDYWFVKLEPDIAPCSVAPSDLFVTNITTNKAKVHWSADPDAIKYKVQYRESTSPVWTSLNATSNVKTISGLAANTTYKYRVRSLCAVVSPGPWSSVSSFTTLPLKEGELNAENNLDINIYPNPNNGTFNLNIQGLNDERLIEIRITNLLGEEIYSQIISDNEELNQTIELNHAVESGMYILEINSGNKIVTEQIIISK